MLPTVHDASSKCGLEPVDFRAADAAPAIPRSMTGGPWLRFVVAPAKALELLLVA